MLKTLFRPKARLTINPEVGPAKWAELGTILLTPSITEVMKPLSNFIIHRHIENNPTIWLYFALILLYGI